MGVENNECVVATTWSDEAMQKVKEWVYSLTEEEQSLFAFTTSIVNSEETLFMGPDGSKKGRETAEQGEALRDKLIALLETFDYEDGSNPFSWIEAGYGKFGQKVLRGNCTNCYSDEPYAI